MQVEDILERRARVCRETEARHASFARDARGCQDETTGKIGFAEIGNGADVTTRDDQYVERRCHRLRIERDDVGVLEADRRGSLMCGDLAEDAVAPRVDSRSYVASAKRYAAWDATAPSQSATFGFDGSMTKYSFGACAPLP